MLFCFYQSFDIVRMRMKISTIFLALLLAGCAVAPPMLPGAEKVRVTSEPVPKNCRNIGRVTADDTNGVTQSYTSHEHLIEDETNNLKDQAFAIGANTVQITQHETTYTQNYSEKPKVILPTQVDQHQLSGEAYFCPTNTH